jgi:UDP-N-acetylmuramate--alanine ligase
VTYGFGAQTMLTITQSNCGNGASDFRLRYKGSDLGYFHVAVPGVHNVLNATAAVAVAMQLNVDHAKIRDGLAQFSGVDRRFQRRGTEKGVTVIDDYGHHPTEIRATLAAARECNYGRVLALFQPHRYTRTFHLLDEFARAFHDADQVYVLDIYAASEKPIEGVSAESLADRMRSFGHRAAVYSGSIENAVDALAREAREGDAVMTLGAGNVWQAGDRLLARLRETGT